MLGINATVWTHSSSEAVINSIWSSTSTNSAGNRAEKFKQERDGYRKTSRGASGVATMKLDEKQGDEIVRVHTIPDLADQLFLLTGKGMMIRVRADQTKETSGKATKGTRVMELR
ncbi:MAG TPA: DNA gyrase C-terminal beta-propeller domain-containing protein, partial [Candidatus Poseidoniales archaeon]|nr:DNA gyrase C-terminal beta-propeller domain-containing protein [Candidatus Poseidoniales archaeon]